MLLQSHRQSGRVLLTLRAQLHRQGTNLGIKVLGVDMGFIERQIVFRFAATGF